MHWIAPSEKDSANGTLEKRLWDAADQFRTNSGLKAQEYSSPVLGLIFLRFADVRFAAVRARLDAGGVSSRRASRVDDATAYHAEGVLFLSPEARFEHLLSLPEGADVGKAINDAMRDIEKHNPQLAGVLPKTYNLFTGTLLKELLKKVSEIPATVDYDAFGRIYEKILPRRICPHRGPETRRVLHPVLHRPPPHRNIEPYHGRILDPACGSGGSLPASRLCGVPLRGKGSRYRAWRCAVGKIRRIPRRQLRSHLAGLSRSERPPRRHQHLRAVGKPLSPPDRCLTPLLWKIPSHEKLRRIQTTR